MHMHIMCACMSSGNVYGGSNEIIIFISLKNEPNVAKYYLFSFWFILLKYVWFTIVY